MDFHLLTVIILYTFSILILHILLKTKTSSPTYTKINKKFVIDEEVQSEKVGDEESELIIDMDEINKLNNDKESSSMKNIQDFDENNARNESLNSHELIVMTADQCIKEQM